MSKYVVVKLMLDPADLDLYVERLVELLPPSSLSPAAPLSPWLSGAEQAAEYLGWPVGRVYKFIREMPHYRVGARVMFRREELDAWVSEHRVGSPPVALDRSSRSLAGVPGAFQIREEAHG
jgi:excisionase family DNA binding protein